MYPLPVILVGIEEVYLPVVRRELTHGLADVESEFVSPGAAFECLRRSKKQARLMLVQMGAECDDGMVRRLSDYFSSWPILALMPAGSSLQDVLRTNRAGACQVVPLPLDHDDFQQALKLIEFQFGREMLDRHVFAVTGAVGGSGATTTAINLAYEIATRYRRSTILAELTPQVGALASMLDVHPRVTLPQLLQEIHRVDDLLVEKALIPVTDGFKVLAGSHEVCPLPFVEPAHLARIVGYLKKLADVVVLDISGTFSDAASDVLNTADHVILVGLQTVPSIRTLKLYCAMFPAERLNHSLWIVINRYNPDLKGFTAADIRSILGTPRILTIANDFRAISLAINHGRPLRHVAPQTPILRDLDVLIHGLLGLERRKSQRNGRGLLGRVFDTLKRSSG